MTEYIKDDTNRTRCEVWSRVMGYFRPTSEWNVGKKQEHCDRKHFVEEKYNGREVKN